MTKTYHVIQLRTSTITKIMMVTVMRTTTIILTTTMSLHRWRRSIERIESSVSMFYTITVTDDVDSDADSDGNDNDHEGGDGGGDGDEKLGAESSKGELG